MCFPDISISLTRYREPDAVLQQALESLSAQREVRAAVYVLDQQKSEETRACCRSLSTPDISFQYSTISVLGLSQARNLAIQLCDTELLLFLDSDAVVSPDWAMQLATTLSKPGVAVAGSRIIGVWQARKPLLCRSSFVAEQFSMLEFGPDELAVSKVIGAGFGIHLRRLGSDGWFDEDLGRKPGGLEGGEETDLCDRARAAGHEVRYNGASVVHHQIGAERAVNRWIARRLYYAGVSRAQRGGFPAATHRQRSVWDWLLFPAIVAPYAAGYLTKKISRAGGS
jgi:GT2 family glycosyltransferase